MKTHLFKPTVANLFLIGAAAMLFSSCYAIRAYKFRHLELLDHEKLPSLNIEAAANPFQYAANKTNAYSDISNWLDSNLQQTYTAAFLVIKNDTVLYEKYFDQYNRQTLLPSFSVAKSFVSTLVGIALEEGKIKSLCEPITNYIPELAKKDKRFKNITIQHLLDMRSGIAWNEGDYGLKDDAIKMGFRPNMMRYIKKIKIATAPKDDSEYKSINTMLLGIIVTRATGKQLNKYLQEKIWQPLGIESHATWNTDKKKLPVTYGGLNATARDFAKLGTLFLKKGVWNGKQIISKDWVNASVSKDSLEAYGGYRNQWWGAADRIYFKDSATAAEYINVHSGTKISSYTSRQGSRKFYSKLQTNRYFAEGLLGQFVYVSPDKNLVIVRLGHNWAHPKFYLKGFIEQVEKEF
jgi:CubicO group peptidase (beta-lactamase class C family)